MTTTAINDYLTLTHRPDLDMVTARWTRPATSTELRAGYQELLRYASGCEACRHWLIDSRRRTQVDARDVHWLAETFYPALRHHLHGQAYLAFLIAPYQLDDVQDDTLPPLPHTYGDNCSINQFVDEAEAVAWLSAQP